jgi:hypothetical protein
MASRTILHVGTMKSGTTHVQSRLFTNQQALAGVGVLVPGRHWGDQARGVSDLLRIQRRGPRRARGYWQQLIDEIDSHPGPAVVSMEFLGPSTPGVIAGICESLNNVEAVVTVRDLNRTLAAMWQETIQNGSEWGYRDYLDSAQTSRPGVWPATEERPPPGRAFWRQQDVVRMTRDWQVEAPVTIVTVPPPGAPRSLLWQRLCTVLGVPADGWSEARKSNESIGAESAALLRELNEALKKRGFPSRSTKRVRKYYLAKRVLAQRKEHETAIGLPVAPWVEDEAHRMMEELKALGPTLVGDYAELEPVPVAGVDPTEVDPTAVVSAGVEALVGMLTHELEG